MTDWFYRGGIVWFVPQTLKCFSAVPSPISRDLLILNIENVLDWIGTSSEPETTEQNVEAMELKWSNDFTGMQSGGWKFAAWKSRHWMTELQSLNDE